MIVDALEHESPQWHAERATGIGGSEIPIIAGIAPASYGTPSDIWALKVHGTQATPTERMEWGQRLENTIIDAWCERSGIDPASVSRQKMARSDDPKAKFVRATLDGVAADTLIEAKNAEHYPWGDDPPAHYVAQCIWQMGAAGVDRSELVSLHRGNELRSTTIEFDPKVFDRLVQIGAEFWQSVLDGRHPAGALDAPASLVDQARQLVELGTQRRQIEQAEKALKADIAAALDGHTEAHHHGVTLVTRRPTERTTLDVDRMVEALAEATHLDVDTVRAVYARTTTTYTIRPGKAAKQ